MEESTEKTEKSPNLGGRREGSGRKVHIERLIQEKVADQFKIKEAQFWVNLAEKYAVPRLQEILTSPLDVVGGKTLLGAVKETLDRAMGKPKESIDHTTNGKDLPMPILPLNHVRSNNSDAEDPSAHQADTSTPGGNVVKQDSVDALIPDSESTG